MAWSAIVNFTKDDSGRLHIVGKTIGSSRAEAQLAANRLSDFIANGRKVETKSITETATSKDITSRVTVHYGYFHFCVRDNESIHSGASPQGFGG